MIFAIITLLAALALASVVGWFSIIGFTAIYAGAPTFALIMGVVLETSKLVTISWVYRNWKYAGWRLKLPLLYFIMVLMLVTSIGVFGFLSKAHLEQGASTIDNSAKVESIDYQIAREKSVIADNQKIIAQLDEVVNTYISEGYATKSISVRKAQKAEREDLWENITESQKKIDILSSQKFSLESAVRQLELEVGPIRYIAELIYGQQENTISNIEAAVRIFTLLIVSTLDPLAVVLLIAANHTLLRLKDEKEKIKEQNTVASNNTSKNSDDSAGTEIHTRVQQPETDLVRPYPECDSGTDDTEIHNKIPDKINENINSDPPEETQPPVITTASADKSLIGFLDINVDADTPVSIATELDVQPVAPAVEPADNLPPPILATDKKTPWVHQSPLLDELLGNGKHFIPEKVIDPATESLKSSKTNPAETKGQNDGK